MGEDLMPAADPGSHGQGASTQDDFTSTRERIYEVLGKVEGVSGVAGRIILGGRCVVGLALTFVAVQRIAFVTSSEQPSHNARRMTENTVFKCQASRAGLPVQGVRYAPHLVGEPYVHPESEPLDYYDKTYAEMHRRDLPLIGWHVGADTLSLRPWPTDVSRSRTQRRTFFREMQNAGICKVIPTFHLAKYYADMLREGMSSPRTDPSSALAVDFTRFGASLNPELLAGVEMVAWTVDLSLDMSELLGLVGGDCRMSQVTEVKSFHKYIQLLHALEQWVRPGFGSESVAPELASKPFLVPLDLSRVSWAAPFFRTRLNTFIRCMSTSVMEGGWSPFYQNSPSGHNTVRWLLSFSEPVSQKTTFDFRSQLLNVSRALAVHGARAVIMVASVALKKGEVNPINSVNMVEDFSANDARYQDPVKDYNFVNKETKSLDGIIYDEWMDDWDRGTRGPFFLATQSLHEMKENCRSGSRFSHNVDACSRIVGNNGLVYPEFFGLAGASSQISQHCVHPRFSVGIFSNRTGHETPLPRECAFMVPSMVWMWAAAGLLVFVAVIQVGKMVVKWMRHDPREILDKKGSDSGVVFSNLDEQMVAHLEIIPEENRLAGGHQFELLSRRLRSNEDVGWWLWMHTSTQMGILEKQVSVEAWAQRAMVNMQSNNLKSSEEDDSQHRFADEELAVAMRVVHRRALEGFAAFCLYVSGSRRVGVSQHDLNVEDLKAYAQAVQNNSCRSLTRLFSETLLLRVLESLGEQILQCPERISYILFHIFQYADGPYDDGPATFSIDLDELHDGLLQMSEHTNPYIMKRNYKGVRELGLNFDDINESGIQCRRHVAKTYKEPASASVVVDFIICYRVPIMIKAYCLALAGYIYLGSGVGDDITTTHNGSFFEPKWLRLNYIQYIALFDALVWVCIETLLIFYTTWQRWPSLGYRSPGIPGLRWFLQHIVNVLASVFGGMMVYHARSFDRKPWECAESDEGVCADARHQDVFAVLRFVIVYWACRLFLFIFLNTKHAPMFLYGTPDSKSRKNSGRGLSSLIALDFRVLAAWSIMLALCIFIEVVMLLRSMKGLDWSTTCGMDILGPISGMPMTQGVCTESSQVLSFGCMTCLCSVAAGWLLVFLGSMVDVYFVFYIASAFFGSIMGHSRHLNDLKNTSVPIDLRAHVGREAQLFEHTFGPGWQQIWRVMVKGLYKESFISPKQASSLAHAAGVSLDGEAPLTSREKKQKSIHLTRFPDLAAERLAFFFQSLKWIANYRTGKRAFESSTDSLTGVDFEVGTIPSLTQIIPAYNEVVIPSAEFLRAGSDPDDARNGSPDDQPGLGDLTLPPQGDGVNTNLAFMISQFPDEWVFLAQRLHVEGWTQSAESKDVYHDFMKQKCNATVLKEVRMWAAMRCQSVAKTVIGALQYGRALATLPKIKEHYAAFPEKRVPENHSEVILAHQTYGHAEGNPQNDEAVRMLLETYAEDPLFLVFDLQKGTADQLVQMVEEFLRVRGGYREGAFQQASVKCTWDKVRCGLRVVEVLPRKFPLRLGQGDYKTQGKACNQLNGLRFASGHYVQALDCNMGTFIGEAFKIPYVLRLFMPLDQADRSAPRCRYLGFREFIYTGREGTVGKCHAAAEWTFGTINQRFLSGMGIRMHYGHPDFLDGFWARNRGGMSKSSPVVNLSEDIFAGYNVRLREETSPHIDALEFEKGREATFNAASNFFSKISGGSIAVIRSRDNHLLCERIGIVHSMSFYFSSVSFYASNLVVDWTIYLYVILFILFNLAGLGPGKLAALGSTFQTEWILSMGLVTLIPQLAELILEYGAVHAVKEAVGGLFAATFFFIFQNKNIAEAMKEGTKTGLARYFFTGRPPANQHQSWRDIYTAYWKSHYKPAFFLITCYIIYSAIAHQNEAEGKLPMVLVVISMIAWIITPILFSPFPRWNLIYQDLWEFNNFITSSAGSHEADISEVVNRGKKGTVRSLYECGLAEELCVWSEQNLYMLISSFFCQCIVGVAIIVLLPAEVLDFLPIFLVILSLSWLAVFGYFAAGLNNVFLVMSFLLWVTAIPLGHIIIGGRFASPDGITRLPEYVISITVFIYLVSLTKQFVLLLCRIIFSVFPCLSKEAKERRMQECIRACFVYFLVQQVHMMEAYVVLCANTLTSILLAIVDQAFCNRHTWWLLNSELGRTPHGESYMKKGSTFFELDKLNFGSSDLWASDDESDLSGATGDDIASSVHSRPWA